MTTIRWTHRQAGAAFALLLLAGSACDQRPEANGGPRVASLHAARLPYPPVADLPAATAGVTSDAEQFVVVDRDELVRLGTRGGKDTTEVSTDELLRAFWRLRRDPLGGRGAATPSAAPLVIAAAAVPAARVIDVVTILWQHGARLAVGGGVPGAGREHTVRLVSERSQAPLSVRGPIVELGPGGLLLDLPGEEPQTFEGCGRDPNTACLARALDAAAVAGVRTVFLRRTN